MLRRLIISFVMLLTIASAISVSAQSTLYRDFAPSSKEPYSESKRLYHEGVKYALAGLYAQAAQIFQQVVKLDPHFADAHFSLGHAYADMGRWQNAIDSFQKAVELNPNDVEAQDRLEQARDMLARQTGHKPEKQPAKKELPKTQPTPEPIGEQVSLNTIPVTPVRPAPAPATDGAATSQTETSTREPSTSETWTTPTGEANETTTATARAS